MFFSKRSDNITFMIFLDKYNLINVFHLCVLIKFVLYLSCVRNYSSSKLTYTGLVDIFLEKS